MSCRSDEQSPPDKQKEGGRGERGERVREKGMKRASFREQAAKECGQKRMRHYKRQRARARAIETEQERVREIESERVRE